MPFRVVVSAVEFPQLLIRRTSGRNANAVSSIVSIVSIEAVFALRREL